MVCSFVVKKVVQLNDRLQEGDFFFRFNRHFSNCIHITAIISSFPQYTYIISHIVISILNVVLSIICKSGGKKYLRSIFWNDDECTQSFFSFLAFLSPEELHFEITKILNRDEDAVLKMTIFKKSADPKV